MKSTTFTLVMLLVLSAIATSSFAQTHPAVAALCRSRAVAAARSFYRIVRPNDPLRPKRINVHRADAALNVDSIDEQWVITLELVTRDLGNVRVEDGTYQIDIKNGGQHEQSCQILGIRVVAEPPVATAVPGISRYLMTRSGNKKEG